VEEDSDRDESSNHHSPLGHFQGLDDSAVNSKILRR